MNAFRPADATMTPEEAQAVVRRHLERLPSGEAGPSVDDVAEALGVSPEKVAAILAEVRATPATSTKRRSAAMPTVAALLFAFSLAVLFARGTPSGRATALPTEFTNYQVVSNGGGSMSFSAAAVDPKALLGNLDDLSRSAIHAKASSEAEAKRGLGAIGAGHWEKAPQVVIVTYDVRKPGKSGNWVRWIRARLPYYGGDDARIDALCFEERDRRLAQAIADAPR